MIYFVEVSQSEPQDFQKNYLQLQIFLIKMEKENKGEEFSDNDDYEEETPLEAKVWQSDTQIDILQEIANFTVPDRPLIKMQFIKKKKDFGGSFKFSDQETSERAGEVKTQDKDPLAQQKNKVIDMGIQGCNPFIDSSTQTQWNRKINKGLQIEEGVEQYIHIDEEKINIFVGGAMNGQVFLWDLNGTALLASKMNQKQNKKKINVRTSCKFDISLITKLVTLGLQFDIKHFTDGQILFGDTRLFDKDSKKIQDISTVPWKAYGIQFSRPERGGSELE
ncbi:hypothetical protein pb186bvf_021137 [Paramecium bursaria]